MPQKFADKYMLALEDVEYLITAEVRLTEIGKKDQYFIAEAILLQVSYYLALAHFLRSTRHRGIR